MFIFSLSRFINPLRTYTTPRGKYRKNKTDYFQDIEIACDQVDSTYLNPKRLLRKICTEKSDHLYKTFEFTSLLFYKLDSDDHKLTIRIKDQYGPIRIPDHVSRKKNSKNVTICLQLQPIENEGDRWIKYI